MVFSPLITLLRNIFPKISWVRMAWRLVTNSAIPKPNFLWIWMCSQSIVSRFLSFGRTTAPILFKTCESFKWNTTRVCTAWNLAVPLVCILNVSVCLTYHLIILTKDVAFCYSVHFGHIMNRLVYITIHMYLKHISTFKWMYLLQITGNLYF